MIGYADYQIIPLLSERKLYLESITSGQFPWKMSLISLMIMKKVTERWKMVSDSANCSFFAKINQPSLIIFLY
jgi:hypothetical protein